jgi:hypothetical protein
MDVYHLYQTPPELCKDLIAHVPLQKDDIVLEPFKGEGGFFNVFPEYVQKEWCEITQGKNYTEYTGDIDWVITNPPFRLEGLDGRRNAFWELIEYYSLRVKKGICFLGNDRCISSLTPRRLEQIKALGFSIQKIVVCNVKKWRGRYYFIIISKEPSHFYHHLLKVY